jgi:hypothetical protein
VVQAIDTGVKVFQAKAPRFDANGYACGRRNPLRGVVVGTSFVLGLWVKILDHFGLYDGVALHCYPLRGIVMEFWYALVFF